MDARTAAVDRQLLSADHLRQRARLFATPADEARARRAGDAIQLTVCAFVLVGLSMAAEPEPGFVGALGRFLTALPDFLDTAWQFLADLLTLFGVVVVLATLCRRRWSIARDLGLALVVATVLWVGIARVVEGDWPAAWDALRSAAPPAWFPQPRLAIVGATVLTASPHLTLPMRRLGSWLLGLAALALCALGATSPLGALAGLLVAVIAAAAVHLAMGSSAGRPGLPMVRSALSELGVATASLGVADRQLAGLFVLHGTDAAGNDLVVKVYGRDAHDTALAATLWRRVWYRQAGSPMRLGRLQQVEHEAFLTLFAGQGGILTDRVVTAGATAADDALLVLHRRGRLLTEVDPERRDRRLLEDLWPLVGRLHDAGLAHGQLDDRQLLLTDDGRLGITDFRGASVAATDAQRHTDQVQALVTTAALAGPQAAVDVAVAALGAQELTAMLPYVQVATLTPRQREWVSDGDVALDELRRAAGAAVGTEPPALIQLRRVTVGSLVRVVLPAIAVIALFSGLAGLDFAELVDQLRDATWWLVILGVLITQLPRLTQAVSTLGASPVPLPLGPVYALQLAVSYVNLAIPTAAARVAVNIRFFQRHGVPPGSAVAAGAIDGFGGFVVQALILLCVLLFTPVSLDLDLTSTADSASAILLAAVLIGVAAIGVLGAVARWRRFVVGWARRLLAEAWGALRGLGSLRRLVLLFGGNLATEVLFALGLATFTSALGSPVGLGDALVINISVALLSGLIPVPGGIGVAEGGLTFGLVQAGMPDEVAFAAVLMYRLSSFYLPPIWGFFALRWLERNEHL